MKYKRFRFRVIISYSCLLIIKNKAQSKAKKQKTNISSRIAEMDNTAAPAPAVPRHAPRKHAPKTCPQNHLKWPPWGAQFLLVVVAGRRVFSPFLGFWIFLSFLRSLITDHNVCHNHLLHHRCHTSCAQVLPSPFQALPSFLLYLRSSLWHLLSLLCCKLCSLG